MLALKGCTDADCDDFSIREECPDEKGTAAMKGGPDKGEDKAPDPLNGCPAIQGQLKTTAPLEIHKFYNGF